MYVYVDICLTLEVLKASICQFVVSYIYIVFTGGVQSIACILNLILTSDYNCTGGFHVRQKQT